MRLPTSASRCAGSRTRRLAARALLLVLGVGVGGVGGVGGATIAAAQQAGPDAFYLALLRDGKSEMLRGDTIAAKRSFRLACFGFLEQPVLLAEGLVRLGLAEAALSDREAFVATFARLAEVEERFAAYAPAALAAEERRAFEEKALEWVTPELLRSLPSFAPLLARKSAVDFAKLSPRDRTRELEKRAAAEPGVPRWRVLLAEEDAAAERWAKALARLEGVPDGAESESAGRTAGCLRGRALAALKRCEEAVVPLAACAATTSDPGLAEARLTCLVALDRSDAARELAAKIVRPAAESPAVRKAIARIPEPRVEKAPPERAAPTAAPPAKDVAPVVEPRKSEPRKVEPTKVEPKKSEPKKGEPAAKPVESSPSPRASASAPANPPAEPANLTALTPDEERIVADARVLLKTVEDRDALRRGFVLLRPVAERLPGRSDLQLLAGEIGYRAGLWSAGAEYFKRSTSGGRGPVDPTQRFYYAVCLYEAGDFAGAAEVAATGLEKLQRPPFVESYLQKIRAARP